MNPFRAFLTIHKGLRKAQAAYRRKKGLAPTQLPWEGEEGETNVSKFLVNILMQSKFAGHRREIALALMGGALLIQDVLCNPDLGAAIPQVAGACASAGPVMTKIMLAVGGWSGLVGWLGKAKPATEPQ